MSERAYWVMNNTRTETIPLTPAYYPKRLSEVGSEVLSASQKMKHTWGSASSLDRLPWQPIICHLHYNSEMPAPVEGRPHPPNYSRELEPRTLFKACVHFCAENNFHTHTLQLPTKSFSFGHTHGWMDGWMGAWVVNRTIVSNFLKSGKMIAYTALS